MAASHLVAASLLFLASADEARGQQGGLPTVADASPEAVAEAFFAELRTLDWTGVAELLHPEGLQVAREHVLIVLQADTDGEVWRDLLNAPSAAAVEGWPPRRVLVRLLAGMTAAAPGLVHAMSTREVEVLGHVREGERAHVVYRKATVMPGYRDEALHVLSLRLDDGAWRVSRSEEMDVLLRGFRGLPRVRANAPPPVPGPRP